MLYNIILYNSDADCWKKAMLILLERNKFDEDRISQLELKPGTHCSISVTFDYWWLPHLHMYIRRYLYTNSSNFPWCTLHVFHLVGVVYENTPHSEAVFVYDTPLTLLNVEHLLGSAQKSSIYEIIIPLPRRVPCLVQEKLPTFPIQNADFQILVWI